MRHASGTPVRAGGKVGHGTDLTRLPPEQIPRPRIWASGGDHALNRALHTVAITRMSCHPETRAYEAWRTLQGKTHRDIRRCLKRSIARRLYRVMESSAGAHPTIAGT